MGKRPDDTARIAKRIAQHLEPGERVVAAVHLQKPGTLEAGMQVGASAAVGATMGLPPRFPDGDPGEERAWRDETTGAGLDEEAARKAHWVYLVLTSSRLLLIRRSRFLRWRPREVIAAWPLREIERIEVPRNGSAATIHHRAGALTFELPQAHKFLPQVYRDLPALHREAVAILE